MAAVPPGAEVGDRAIQVTIVPLVSWYPVRPDDWWDAFHSASQDDTEQFPYFLRKGFSPLKQDFFR